MQSSITLGSAPHLKTIGEMARSFDVTLRSLRFYEQIGLICPKRVGSERLYSAKDEIRLRLIITGKKFGLTLRDIAALIESRLSQATNDPSDIYDVLDSKVIERQVSFLVGRRSAIDAAITELNSSLARMEAEVP